MHKILQRIIIVFCLTVATALIAPEALQADEAFIQSKGQTVYLPVYSYIYFGNRGKKFNLTVTLSLRNTDPARSVIIQSADYYDPDGKVVKKFVKEPITLGPMSSTRFLVAESDAAGGSGASLLVEWTAEQPASPPLIQAVMIGAEANQGISFVCNGRPIKTSR